MDVVVRAVIIEVYGTQEAHHGFGWAEVKHNIFLYVDDGQILGRNSIRLQTTLTGMVSMFGILGLQKNLGNTKAMVFTPGFNWLKQGLAAYKRGATGKGGNFRE